MWDTYTRLMKGDTSFVCQFWGGAKKAFWGSTILILFGLMILTMSVFAMHDGLGAFDNTMTATSAGKIEYYLPYPGILPDNGFYKLKALRDKVVLLFTLKPEMKAEKELLYANKRIGAAKYLVEGGKIGLGVATATKAEKYLESAFARLDKLSKEGRDMKSQILELSKAAVKHQEILEEIVSKSTDIDRNVIEETLKMNKLLQQRINQTWLEAK